MDEEEYREYDTDRREAEMNEYYSNAGESQYPDYPETQAKDTFFRLFRDIIKSDDSKKIGNLNNTELGSLKLPVRCYLDVANYNYAENCSIVGDYLTAKAEVIASTSLSRDAKLLNTLVTNIRKSQITKTGGEGSKKGFLFSNNKKSEE